jgi:hypothetical protein
MAQFTPRADLIHCDAKDLLEGASEVWVSLVQH